MYQNERELHSTDSRSRSALQTGPFQHVDLFLQKMSFCLLTFVLWVFIVLESEIFLHPHLFNKCLQVLSKNRLYMELSIILSILSRAPSQLESNKCYHHCVLWEKLCQRVLPGFHQIITYFASGFGVIHPEKNGIYGQSGLRKKKDCMQFTLSMLISLYYQNVSSLLILNLV